MLPPKVYFIKYFTGIITSVQLKAKVFVSTNKFHPSLIFPGKAGTFPGGACEQVHTITEVTDSDKRSILQWY